MHPDEIATLQAVARHLSFRKAADELFVTQQAISARVVRMERRLGLRLFVRTTRRVELTPAAEILVSGFAQAQSMIDATITAASNVGFPAPETLKVMFYDLNPRRYVRQLRLALPETTIIVSTSSDIDAALPAVESGQIQVLVAHLLGNDQDLPAHRLVADTLRRSPAALIQARSPTRDEATVLSMQQIAGLAWVGRTDAKVQSYLDRVFSRAWNFVPSPKNFAADNPTIQFLVHEAHAVLSPDYTEWSDEFVRIPLPVPLTNSVRMFTRADLPGPVRTLIGSAFSKRFSDLSSS